MAKQLNVNLGFTADTSQAKTKIQELQSQLNSLISNGTKTSPLGLDKELSKAISKASELKASLDSAMTPSGTLDLNKFNQSLQANKTKISEYAAELSKLGPAGQQAFATLAQSVNLSSVQLQKSNGLLSQFAVTLKNTAKWQISSSILHGFIGAIQSAYGYAQDLNESLNNIRIVTGANVEDMSKFADQANRAAKALSTTTTAYTDAALIFYQQGLKGNDVTDRADVTIKMANASRQSAEIVSDQLTAIWNNFYDGSESLESYADKITALGAATASSSEEISTGLEKFASVAETVGLSYDYATAALATVTATTRQSADVVGTAFKTLFARLNDLKLGETLDDGTTLGQYTENLAKVGVNIKDVSGQLKDMDIILEETAVKWKELDKDQQVALAKGVAGIRQYNQFIALMSNWDFMKENLKVVEESGGALQKQADIYSEGWDAASKRVRASSEAIYRSLFDDKFFINMTDGFSKVLDTIKGMIDGLGGFKGALSLLSTVLIRVFSKDLSVSIDNFLIKIQQGTQKIASLKKSTETKAVPENSAIGLKREMNKSLANMYDDGTIAGSAQVDIYKQQASLQDVLLDKTQNLLRIGKELSEEEQKQAGIQLDIVRSLGEQAIQAAKNRQESEETTLELERQVKILLQQNEKNPKTKNYKTKTFDKDIKAAKELQEQYALGSTLVGKLQKEVSNMGSKSPADIEKVITKIKSFIAKADELGIDISKLALGLKKITDIKITGEGAFGKLEKAISSLDHDLIDLGADAQNTFDKIRQDASNAGIDMSKMGPILDNLQQEFSQTGKFTSEQINLLNSLGVIVDEAGMRFEGFKGKITTMGQSLTALANTISTTTMLLNSIFGLIDTWNNEDLSFGEKLLNTFTTLGMVLPMVITAFNAQNLAQMSVASSAIAAMFGVKGLAITMGENGVLTNAATEATIGFGTALWTVLWPIGLVMAAVAALIATIYGLVKLFDHLITTENEAKEAAAAHAKEMAEGLNKAKEAASELKSAFDEYEDVSKTLEECTKETEAWTEALKANNDKVIELMNKYPQLSTMVNEFGEKAVTTNKETGALEIADWAMEDMEFQANQAVAVATSANFQAKRNIRETNIEYLEKDTNTDLNYYYRGNLKAKNVAKQVVANYGENATKKQFMDAMKAQEPNISDSYLETLGNYFDSMSEDLIELQGAIEENTMATEAENLAATTQALSSNTAIQESGFAEEIAQVTARGYDEDVDKQIEALKNEGWGTNGISKATGVNDEARDVFARYAEVAEITDYDLTDTTGTDRSREFVYTDSEGEEVTVSLEAMRAIVAAAEANKDLQSSAEELIKTFNNLKNSSNEADNAMISFLSQQNFEAASKAEAEDITDIDDVESYLNEILGGEDGILSDEEAQKLGYDSAQSMISAFEEQQENIQEAWNDISLPSNFDKSMDAAADNMSLETAQKLEKTFEKMNLGPIGAEAGELFTEQFGSEIAKIEDSDKQQEALSKLAEIDWSNYDAIEEADAIMKEFGVSIDTSSEEWVEFANKMRNAGGAIPDFNKLKENLMGVANALKDIDFGDIISQEDYDKIVALNDEWERFFIMQANGSRRFIGNVEDMKQATIDSIMEQKKVLSERATSHKDFVGSDEKDLYGWNSSDWSNTSGSNVGKAISLLQYEGGRVESAVNQVGYSYDQLQTIVDDVEDGVEGSTERLAEFYRRMGNFIDEDVSSQNTELNESLLSTTISIAELDAMVAKLKNNGEIIPEEMYKKQFDYLVQVSFESAESLEELNKAMQTAQATDEEIDYSAYATSLTKLAENYISCADEIDDFNDALASGSAKSVQYAQQMLELAIQLGQAAEKYGLDEEILAFQAKNIAEADLSSIMTDENKQLAYARQKYNISWYDPTTEEYANADTYLNKEGTDTEIAKRMANVGAGRTSIAIEAIGYTQGQLKGITEAADAGDTAAQNELKQFYTDFGNFLEQDFSQQLINAKRKAQDLAIANSRMNKGVADLKTNYKDWTKLLKNNGKISSEYAETMLAMKDSIANIFNTDANLLSNNFIESLIEDGETLERIINGDVEAIKEMRLELGNEVAMNLMMTIDDLAVQAEVQSLWDKIKIQLDELNNSGQLEVGMSIDSNASEANTELINNLNQMISAAGYTKEQVQSLLGSMGMSTTLTTEWKEQKIMVPVYQTYQEEQEDGSMISHVVPLKPVEVDGWVETVAIGTTDADGNTTGGQIDIIDSGSMNFSNTPAGDTSGSTSKGKDSRKKKTDVVDRYKEVNDSLEKTNRLMQKNSILAEGMWGKDKINMMKQNVNLMKQENELLEDKLDLANGYLAEDRTELEATGIGFTFDESGAITNYTQQMESLYAEYEAQWYTYTGGNEEAEISEDQQKILDDMSERIETIKSAYELYETTLDEVQDLEQEQLDKQLEIQQQNFDILNETLESNIAFEENQLAYIEHQLGRIADDFYQMAEGLALMIGSFDENGNWDSSNSQYGMYVSRGKDYEKQKEELDKQYKNGDINRQQYLDGLEDLSSRVMENENAMRELDNTMMHYYGDTLAAAGERLGRFTALQEHHTSVLDHYTSALELMGKAADPRNMTEIIKAQKDVAKNSLETSKAWYDSMKAQADARKAEYDAAVANGADADTLKWYEEQWLSAQEVANEAEEQMLSDYEAWLEAIKAETQNAIDIQNKEWEKSLIAGMFGENNKFNSFEDVNLALDRQKSLQEDILTTTNKKYETDKLIRQVQQDIDKSTNSIAKKELKAFIERTQAKQDQTELSETELGILQKEYELLQAKIALEEAQNAKSTVRLQRDSEGNFGYVYTADENKIADAEQNYADKENELYNARLDAANDYSEKYIQAQMEMHQTLSDLHQQYLDGEFESEEAYNNAVTAAKEYYYELLEQYQDIYHNIFADNSTWINDFMSEESDSLHHTVTTNAVLMADSIIGQSGLATEQWSNNFDAQDARTQAWKNTTEGYISNVSTAFGTMQTTINGKAQLLGIDLDSIKKKTGNIVTENNKLTTSIGNESSGLIKGLNDEIVAVQKVTGQYALMREEVGKNITAQENLLAAINASASAIYEQDAPSDNISGSDKSNNNDNSNNGNPGSGSGGSGGGNGRFGSATWERGYAAYEHINQGHWSNYPQRRDAGYAAGFTDDEIDLGQSIIDYTYKTWQGGLGYSMDYAKQLLGFNTGGYTGEWEGGYGKLAFLHQKELVLNQGDTANFLASMELLDSIIKTIDLYSANAQWGGLLSTPTFGNYGSEPLEQNVHIEASFPGVTDKNQIEEAFNDIINLASQYANRKY